LIPDSHSHLDPIEIDPRQAVVRALKEGVGPIVTVGINLASSRAAAGLASGIEGVYATAGIHPNDAGGVTAGDLEELERIITDTPRVVAVGETGLDYYRKKSPADIQKRIFAEQIGMAKRSGKALVIHDREAHRDVLEILAGESAGEVPVIMHCFSGGEDVLEECARRGYYVSFAGPVTFKKAYEAREAASRTPPDRILAETDCPFLSPEPYRGKPTLPERVRLVAERIAEVRRVDVEEMASVLSENTARAFGIEPES